MSMLQTLVNAFAPGGNQGVQARKADIDATKQLTRQRAEQADKDTEDFMSALGAAPVHAGMVHRQMYTPPVNMGDYSDLPGFNLPKQVPATSGYVVDKANPDQLRTHIDADGNKVQWELPTIDQQKLRQAQMALDQLRNPANREAALIQQRQTAEGARTSAQATAQGTAAGKTLGEEENRNTLGTPVTDQEQQTYGLPADTRLTPSERVNLAGKVIPVVTRVAGQTNIAGMNNDARADRQQASIAAKAAGVKSSHYVTAPNGRVTQVTMYNNGEYEETPLEAKSYLKPGAGGGGVTPGQQGVQNRFQQKLAEIADGKQQALQTKENDLWDQKQAFADAAQIPDGQLVIDPGNPRAQPVPMNAAWRAVFAARMRKAEGDAQLAHKGAAEIRKQYGWGEFAPGQQGAPAAGGAAAQPQSAPTAAAPNIPATVGASGPTTVRPFKIGQTVYGKDGKAHKVSGYDQTGKVLLD